MSEIEGQDFGDSGAAVIMDERIPLNAQQADGLNALYAARKEVETRIAFAEQMVGIAGREITGGELGGENPHLTLKPSTNGVSG
tara:strand:- start:311 stop:562 length:252 start_codon:yes stop_codon:yes gene_type:complete